MLYSENPLADVDGFLSHMEALAKLGIDRVWVSAAAEDAPAWVDEVCAQTVSRLAELG